jgi:hypothetical protein
LWEPASQRTRIDSRPPGATVTRFFQHGQRALIAFSILMLALISEVTATASTASAQQTLRANPHRVVYGGILGVVQTVDGSEQYSVGPDTILLGIDVREDSDGNMLAEYTLDLGKGDASAGSLPFSELGLAAERWRPAVEALELVPLLPFPDGAQDVGGEWTQQSRYPLFLLGFDFLETTGFSIESIDGEEVTIRFSTEGVGSTTIGQPHLGLDALKQVTRESTRVGTFVFHVGVGRVLSAERLEKIVTTSVFYLGDEEPTIGPVESQTLTFQLFPMSGSR